MLDDKSDKSSYYKRRITIDGYFLLASTSKCSLSSLRNPLTRIVHLWCIHLNTLSHTHLPSISSTLLYLSLAFTLFLLLFLFLSITLFFLSPHILYLTILFFLIQFPFIFRHSCFPFSFKILSLRFFYYVLVFLSLSSNSKSFNLLISNTVSLSFLLHYFLIFFSVSSRLSCTSSNNIS